MVVSHILHWLRDEVDVQLRMVDAKATGQQSAPGVAHLCLNASTASCQLLPKDVCVTVQDEENCDQEPFYPSKGHRKPMVQLQAGSNLYYQATVVGESSDAVLLLFPPTDAMDQAKQMWVKRTSSRIFRGSLSKKWWKHKGKGAWEPKQGKTKKSSKKRKLSCPTNSMPDGKVKRNGGEHCDLPSSRDHDEGAALDSHGDDSSPCDGSLMTDSGNTCNAASADAIAVNGPHDSLVQWFFGHINAVQQRSESALCATPRTVRACGPGLLVDHLQRGQRGGNVAPSKSVPARQPSPSTVPAACPPVRRPLTSSVQATQVQQMHEASSCRQTGDDAAAGSDVPSTAPVTLRESAKCTQAKSRRGGSAGLRELVSLAPSEPWGASNEQRKRIAAAGGQETERARQQSGSGVDLPCKSFAGVEDSKGGKTDSHGRESLSGKGSDADRVSAVENGSALPNGVVQKSSSYGGALANVDTASNVAPWKGAVPGRVAAPEPSSIKALLVDKTL